MYAHSREIPTYFKETDPAHKLTCPDSRPVKPLLKVPDCDQFPLFIISLTDQSNTLVSDVTVQPLHPHQPHPPPPPPPTATPSTRGVCQQPLAARQ